MRPVRPTPAIRRAPAVTAAVALVVAGVLSTTLVNPASATTSTTLTTLTTTVAPARDRAIPDEPLLEPLKVSAKRPTRAGLTAALSTLVKDPSLGRRVTVTVSDAASGTLLYGRAPGTTVMPASTTKLLTVTAALSLLGPDHRFSTRVVQQPVKSTASAAAKAAAKAAPVIVLVGGGDPLLASRAALTRTAAMGHTVYPGRTTATIDQLADSSAKALVAAGHRRVRLGYDATLFTQPVSPHWRSVYVSSSVVAPVSALWVDEARTKAPYLQRAADPPRDAAARFAALLAKRGIDVAGAPTAQRAIGSAPTLATVSSAPLSSIVEHVLLTSDNDGAEVLARQAALAAGRKPDFAGGAATTLSQLRKLGVDTRGVRLFDGSGLSRDDRISGNTLTQVVRLATGERHPELSAILAGLPVGAFNGSLAARFVSVGRAGAGFVHAKTGTLTGVSSLAGTVLTRDGALLTFAVMADQIGAADARPAQDRIAATLAACGCR